MSSESEAAGFDGAFIPSPPAVPMNQCPIATSLGSLGRKWTLTILRDIAFQPLPSFTVILRNNPGLRQRTLSLRLKQLLGDGLIVRSPHESRPRRPIYRLTPKGLQVWPILATLAQYGLQNLPQRVFSDGRARNLEDVWPNDLPILLGRFAPPSSAETPGTPSGGRARAGPASLPP